MTHNLDAIFIRPLETCIGLGCQSAMCSCYYVRNSSRNARKTIQNVSKNCDTKKCDTKDCDTKSMAF